MAKIDFCHTTLSSIKNEFKLIEAGAKPIVHQFECVTDEER